MVFAFTRHVKTISRTIVTRIFIVFIIPPYENIVIDFFFLESITSSLLSTL
jgi:hypothetical protein